MGRLTGMIYNNQVQVPTPTGGIMLVDRDRYNAHPHEYFIADDGIRYGHEEFSILMLPKEMFVAAYNAFIRDVKET